MSSILDEYAAVSENGVVDQLKQLAAPVHDLKVVHVNSTREGGGVAEILHKLIPLMRALGLKAQWEVIKGGPDFYQCTKGFHNGLQGNPVGLSDKLLDVYEKTNAQNAEEFRQVLEEADIVFIHDPQPAAMIEFCPNRKGVWIWRCHIDASRPYRPVWKYLRKWVVQYDASIFSLPAFAQRLPHLQYMIPPSIDPLSDKNIPLPKREINAVTREFNLDPNIPLILQVSRFDRFKDPLGVIEAYRLARKFAPMQLALVGGTASDDPEGEMVIREVHTAAQGDPNIHILLLPPDSHRKINALQRAADIVMQKSIKEGFGLTVAEAMWKKKPVIGGDTGGIRLQVINHYTGFLVRTPEGAALRIRYLLHNRHRLEEMGERAHRLVKENFLLTRHLREHLTLMLSLLSGEEERIEVGVQTKWKKNQS
ncbi:MAG: glycosyltransferase [Planctomycetota bacterium]|nr:MAG: glycosyltransferase [Planctomycetota bacterium]